MNEKLKKLLDKELIKINSDIDKIVYQGSDKCGTHGLLDYPLNMDFNDVNVKVRNYMLELTLAEFGNSLGNRRQYEKRILPNGMLNIYFNTDLYMSHLAYEELMILSKSLTGEMINPNTLLQCEYAFMQAIKKNYAQGQCSLDLTFFTDGNVVKIDACPEFDMY
jgi:hypothetical protein